VCQKERPHWAMLLCRSVSQAAVRGGGWRVPHTIEPWLQNVPATDCRSAVPRVVDGQRAAGGVPAGEGAEEAGKCCGSGRGRSKAVAKDVNLERILALPLSQVPHVTREKGELVPRPRLTRRGQP
jgi:hypothetical protein